MKYNKVVRGGQLSASQWNGFLDLHREYYGGNANNGPIPPILSKSVIASASLADGSDEIGAYQPVRIVQQVSLDGGTLNLPAYVVEAVDASTGVLHGNYAFTLGEGITSDGGRVVISGLAIAAVLYEDLDVNIVGEQFTEGSESCYYIVDDATLTVDSKRLGPYGHFRLVSWYTRESLDSSKRQAYVIIDLGKRPTSFMAETSGQIDASDTVSGVTTMSSTTAYVYYSTGATGGSGGSNTLEVEKNEAAYEINVFNPLPHEVLAGEHLVTYSAEYNRFVVSTPAPQQTTKIGKADADITVGTTGTVSVWASGSDTTDNVTAKLDWMAGTEKVSLGKEVLLTWFEDEAIWRITGAECEDAE